MKDKLKYVLLIAALLSGFSCFAQGWKPTKAEKKSEDSLNKKDKKNRKQGTWFIQKDALRGEPAYTAFGTFLDDEKEGLWYRLDKEGQLVSIEHFHHGLLDGVSQYFENGRLVCTGTYKSLNPAQKLDSFWVNNPVTNYDTLVIVPTWKGSVKNGLWRYYDPRTGQLTSEETYQYDLLIGKKDFHYTSKTDSLRIREWNKNLPHNKPLSPRSRRKHHHSSFSIFPKGEE
jgi:antitoxin component YwqK of YwqJK toxin-antitoxin module